MSISTKRVSPSGPPGASILIIGEAPGYDEDKEGKPFVGKSGEILNMVLARHGIDRDSCRVTNICNYRPANNDFKLLEGTPQLAEGIFDVTEYIQKYASRTKLIILCGERPLNYILKKYGISKYRGSVYRRGETLYAVVPHPAATLYDPTTYPIFAHDIGKALAYVKSGYKTPLHDFRVYGGGIEAEDVLDEILQAPKIAIDIEAIKKSSHILCCGVAVSETKAYCFYNEERVGQGISSGFRRVLERLAEHPYKIFHNGLYDLEMFRLNGVDMDMQWDTMIAQHVMEPEMPRGLDHLTTIYTDEPYYKDKGKDSIPEDEKGWSAKVDKINLYEYNQIDCIVTYQVAIKQDAEMDDVDRAMFDYEMSMVPVSRHISQSGMLVDEERRELLGKIIKVDLNKRQLLLNNLCGRVVNVNGKIVLRDVLYNQFKLPVKSARSKAGTKVTTKEDAIVELIAYAKNEMERYKTPEKKFEWTKILGALKLILIMRGLLKLHGSYIKFSISTDGRVRCSYGIAATETGRWNSYKYVDGTGLNAQTFPREKLEYD